MKSATVAQRRKIAVSSSVATAKMNEIFANEEQEIFDLRRRIETIQHYLTKPKPTYADHERITKMGLPSLSFVQKSVFWDAMTPAINKVQQEQGKPLLQTEREERIATLRAEIDRCQNAIETIYFIRAQRQEPSADSIPVIAISSAARETMSVRQQSALPQPVAQRTTPVQAQTTTAADLKRSAERVRLLKLSGMYEKLFGTTIGIAPYIVVWGDAGSGKTGFVLKLLKHIRHAGSVLFCTAETMLDGSTPLISLAETTQTTDIPLLAVPTVESFRNILEQQKYQCIALDSASRLAITPEEMLTLRNLAPSMGVIVLLESTKSGATFKGSNEWKHHCNIMVRVEATWNEDGSRRGSQYVVEKNQWGTHGTFRTRYDSSDSIKR